MRTQLAIAQNKFDEALAALGTEFNVANLEAARAEYANITTTIIPNLQTKRDTMLKKAEDILNGIDMPITTGATDPNPPQNARNLVGRGPQKNRHLVGRGGSD